MTPTRDQLDACRDALCTQGGLAVLRTDTIYGIVARADDEQAVHRLYHVRSRDEAKSCIVLIADASEQYGEASIELPKSPDAVSYLLPAADAPSWLLRTNDELAYRIPNVEWLRELLHKTGPLIAPSANPEGLAPARTIDEARKYFGDEVDYYLDGGEVPEHVSPSQLIRIHPDGTRERLR